MLCFFISALFSVFFYAIDLWYFGLFPLAFFLFILVHGMRRALPKLEMGEMRYKYSLFFIWVLIMVGFSGLLFFIGVGEIMVYLCLLALNLFLWIGSYVFGYADGKRIFESGLYLVMVIILGTLLFSGGISVFWSAFSLFSCFLFGVLGFLVGVIGLLYPLDKKYSYQLFLVGGVVLVTLIINLAPSLGWGVLVSLGLLSVYYLAVYWVKRRNIPLKESSTLSVRRVLAGERIKQKQHFPLWKQQLYTRVHTSPLWFQRLLELPNLLLLTTMIVLYIYVVVAKLEVAVDLGYWMSLALFLFNVYVLKKIQYVSNVSRFALALVVNFAVYSAVLKSGFGNVAGILPFLVLWTFICQIALFYVDRLKSRFMFSKKDYLYRTIVTCFASVVNVILLFQVEVPAQFLFGLVFFYCGIELFILYYVFQFLTAEEEHKEI